MRSRGSEVTNERRKIHENETPAAPDAGGPTSKLRFGPFVLDPETGQLREGDRLIPLAPKPFETLCYLARRPGRAIVKSELMEQLWPETFVTDDVLVQCVVDIRKALGDTAKHPQYIQTLPRRGYLFIDSARPGSDAEEMTGPAVETAAAPDRRRMLTWSIGATALAAGLALFLSVRNASNPPAAVTADAAVVPGALLVLPFQVEEPAAENQWLREGLAEILRSELGHRPGIHVVARHRLSAALKSAGQPEKADVGAEAAAAIARSLGAEWMVTGSFVRVEERFVLNAQLARSATGLAEAVSVRGAWPGDLLDRVDALCLKLVERWNAAGGPDGATAAWRPVRASTRSVDAWRNYVEALNWFYRGGEHGASEAERRLDEATRLDPAFAFAYLKKAEIQQWRRRWGYGELDPVPAIRAAARLAKDLPVREQLLVEIMEANIVRDDAAEAARLCEALLRREPSFGEEVALPALLAYLEFRQGRWDDLIAHGEAHVESPSLPGPESAQLSAFLSQAYRHKGDLARSLAHARRAVRLWPTQDGPSFLRQRSDLGRAYLEAGQREDAVAEFRAVASASDADATNLTDAGWGFYMAGDKAQADVLTGRALALDPSYGNAHHLRGWLQLGRNDYGPAARSFETAFERSPKSFGSAHQGFVKGDVPALYYAGVAYQKKGDATRGRAALEKVMALCKSVREAKGDTRAEGLADFEAATLGAMAAARLGLAEPELPRLPGDDATFFMQSARVHAVQGKRELALKDVARALALGRGDRQHILDDPNFESLRGDPEFRKLLGGQ
jgi:DNA-binding winged helix-turn-helix (wHTH) protein/tetratricopeptide (TPR) repeat protein/TolB-like protein